MVGYLMPPTIDDAVGVQETLVLWIATEYSSAAMDWWRRRDTHLPLAFFAD